MWPLGVNGLSKSIWTHKRANRPLTLSTVRASILSRVPSWFPILQSIPASYNSMGSSGSLVQTVVVVIFALDGRKPSVQRRRKTNCWRINHGWWQVGGGVISPVTFRLDNGVPVGPKWSLRREGWYATLLFLRASFHLDEFFRGLFQRVHESSLESSTILVILNSFFMLFEFMLFFFFFFSMKNLLELFSWVLSHILFLFFAKREPHTSFALSSNCLFFLFTISLFYFILFLCFLGQLINLS